MSEIESIQLFFGIFLALGGAVLMLLAFTLGYKYLIQEKRCTAKTAGTVKKYTAASRGSEGNSIHLPVVYYTVEGKEYKVVGPMYKGYVTTSRSSPVSKNTMEHKEKDQVFYVNKTFNSFASVHRNPMEELYPIGSRIDVYYDPKNPKLSYVLRYCNNKWMFWLMFFAGLVVWGMDILILILL